MFVLEFKQGILLSAKEVKNRFRIYEKQKEKNSKKES